MCWSTISFYFKTVSSTVLPLDIPCRFEVSSRRQLWIYPLAFQPYYWAYFILRFSHTVCMPKHAHNIVDSLFNLHLSVECTSFWKWFDYSFHLLFKKKLSIAAQNIFIQLSDRSIRAEGKKKKTILKCLDHFEKITSYLLEEL